MSEIIIDGVNVAECCCYENSKCLWTKRYYENNIVPVCEKVKDCYYKQLKRLEQELKEKDNFLKWLITQQYYIIPKNLKQKIKEILKDV